MLTSYETIKTNCIPRKFVCILLLISDSQTKSSSFESMKNLNAVTKLKKKLNIQKFPCLHSVYRICVFRSYKLVLNK